MYINSTNLALDLPEYNTKVPSSWITSEKYYNCDYFFNYMNNLKKKRKLFHKNK